MVTSGLRIGTPALATRGLQAEDFAEVGADHRHGADARTSRRARGELAERVTAIADRYPLYEHLSAPRRSVSSAAPPGAAVYGSRRPDDRSSTRSSPSRSRFVTAALLTPLAARFATRVGAVDQPARARAARRATRRCSAAWRSSPACSSRASLFLPRRPIGDRMAACSSGAALITLVGALDDRFDLPPRRQARRARSSPRRSRSLAGVEVTNITLPFVGAVNLGGAGGAAHGARARRVMNVVNFSDGVDGLAAGVCAISAIAFAIIAFDLGRDTAGHRSRRSPPAPRSASSSTTSPRRRSSWATRGANLLGLLLGCIAVEGAVKTQAVLALVFPLIVLAVPFLDTAFVVLKRLKYRRPVYEADASHFHHRMSRIGFSQRRTVLYLYGWTLLRRGVRGGAAVRPLLRSDGGDLNTGWTIVMALIGLGVLAASVYLVYVLEILKFKRLTAMRVRRVDPTATEAEIDADTEVRLETGQFDAILPEDVARADAQASSPE